MPQAKRNSKSGKVVVEVEQDRETKNAFRFAEILVKGQDRGAIGTVYILKSDLEKAGLDPESVLRVTVEEAPEAE